MSRSPRPAPAGDPIELRLMVVAEMLEQAVNEVRRTLEQIKGDNYNSVERKDTGSSNV